MRAMSDDNERILLGLLIKLHPAPLSTSELARVLGGKHAATRTEDALAALERAGLAHVRDVLASRAARRYGELEI